MTTGERIRRARERLGLTLEELAGPVPGLSPRSLERVERDEMVPGKGSARIALAAALEESYDDLFPGRPATRGLPEAIEEAGLTADDVAARLGLTVPTVEHYCEGDVPAPSIRRDLAHILGRDHDAMWPGEPLPEGLPPLRDVPCPE